MIVQASLEDQIAAESPAARRTPLRSKAPAASWAWEDSKEDGAEFVMNMARQLFEDADADGSGELDEAELSELMKDLWGKLGRPLKGENRMGLQSEIQKVMRQFDTDNNGTLSFVEFLRMITRKPWKDLFPVEVQDKLPHLVRLHAMQASRAQQPNETETAAATPSKAPRSGGMCSSPERRALWDATQEPAAVVSH